MLSSCRWIICARGTDVSLQWLYFVFSWFVHSSLDGYLSNWVWFGGSFVLKHCMDGLKE